MSRQVVKQYDSLVIDSLADISIPTLILVGEKEDLVKEPAGYMARTIPEAQMVVIPEAGHIAHLDNVEFFNRAVLDFMRELNLPAIP